jgi:ABC-2 type transport system permease protein
MSVWSLFKKDMVAYFRDSTVWLLLVAMPLGLIAALGFGLKPLWTGSSDPVRLAFCDDDGGEMGRSLRVGLQEAVGDTVIIKELASAALVERAVESGSADAGIIVPKDFTSAANRGAATSLSVVVNPASPNRGQVATEIAQALVDQVRVAQTAGQAVAETVAVAASTGQAPAQIRDLFSSPDAAVQGIRAAVESHVNSPGVNLIAEGIEREFLPDSFSYYAVGMAAMYLLFSAQTGAMQIIAEAEGSTLARILVAGHTVGEFLTAKVLGTLALGAIQFSVIAAATRFLFQVNWGNSVLGLMYMVMSAMLATSGIMNVLAAITTNQRGFNNVSVFVTLVMSAVGGSMIGLFLMPEWMQILNLFTVNRWFLQGCINLQGGQGLMGAITPATVLATAGLMLNAIALPVLHKRLQKGAVIDE